MSSANNDDHHQHHKHHGKDDEDTSRLWSLTSTSTSPSNSNSNSNSKKKKSNRKKPKLSSLRKSPTSTADPYLQRSPIEIAVEGEGEGEGEAGEGGGEEEGREVTATNEVVPSPPFSLSRSKTSSSWNFPFLSKSSRSNIPTTTAVSYLQRSPVESALEVEGGGGGGRGGGRGEEEEVEVEGSEATAPNPVPLPPLSSSSSKNSSFLNYHFPLKKAFLRSSKQAKQPVDSTSDATSNKNKVIATTPATTTTAPATVTLPIALDSTKFAEEESEHVYPKKNHHRSFYAISAARNDHNNDDDDVEAEEKEEEQPYHHTETMRCHTDQKCMIEGEPDTTDATMGSQAISKDTTMSAMTAEGIHADEQQHSLERLKKAIQGDAKDGFVNVTGLRNCIDEILECIHFPCYCDTSVEFVDENVAQREFQEDVATCLAAVWTNYVEPRLQDSMHSLAYDLDSDDDDHSTSLPQLLNPLVALVVKLARHVQADSFNLFWLVQQVCATEITGTMAVHKGILAVLANQWLLLPLQDANMAMMRAAVFSVRHLSLVRNLYTTGCIHMKMMDQGVIQALCNFTCHAFINNDDNDPHNDVSTAVAQILAVLSGAPHTRLAVVQGKCFGFLLQNLKQISDENMLLVLKALVELVPDAVKIVKEQNSAIDLYYGILTFDLATALLDDIMQSGAIASLVSIAASAVTTTTTMTPSHGKQLQWVAVAILKFLSSDDTDQGCDRRRKLCHAGATAALGTVLATVWQTMEQQHDPKSVSSLKAEDQLLLHKTLGALANIFDFVRQESQKSKTNNDSMQFASEPNLTLVKGWWDIEKHLTAILHIVRISISSYPYGGITLQRGSRSVMGITKTACRLLASTSPLLMIPKENGDFTTVESAYFSFDLLHDLLQRLVNDLDKVKNTITVETKEINHLLHYTLQGLSALARYEPLKVIDKTTPLLMQVKRSSDSNLNKYSRSVIENLKTLISLGESIDVVPPEGKLLAESCASSMVVTAPRIQHTDNNTTKISITVLFSDPLVTKDSEQNLLAFSKLKLGLNKERELIRRILNEASSDIELRYDTAHVDSFLEAIRRRCSCIHYSGHGHEQYLPFEGDGGETNWFPVNGFKDLIRCENAMPCQLVFVSACYSRRAGETFVDAGIPHVVCCQQNAEVKDKAAHAFTKHFYKSIFERKTVKEAYEDGCNGVLVKYGKEERGKFLLLPENGNHDVPLFESVGKGPSCPDDLEIQNLLQRDPSPKPPPNFLGREIEMYQVLNMILSNQLVSVVGNEGIGRFSLACALCHHINERRSIVIQHNIEKIYFLEAKKRKTMNPFVQILKDLMNKLSIDMPISTDSNDDDFDKAIELVCDRLKNEKALIVFGRIENPESFTETTALERFGLMVRELIQNTSVKVLITADQPLSFPELGEQYFTLGPLNFENTVKLFAHGASSLRTRADHTQFLKSMVTSNEEGKLLYGPDIPANTKILFDKFGRGIPSRILNMAYTMHKDDIKRLKEGTF